MRWALEFLGSLGYLLADTLAALPRSLLTRRGRRLGWSNLWAQMNRVGVSSIPIVSLVLFCIGAILAFQIAPTLATFGMVGILADTISVAIFRELGPLVSAIRTGPDVVLFMYPTEPSHFRALTPPTWNEYGAAWLTTLIMLHPAVTSTWFPAAFNR